MISLKLVIKEIWLVLNLSQRIYGYFGTVPKGYMVSLELVLKDIWLLVSLELVLRVYVVSLELVLQNI